jgi:uncharacterized protein YjbI with pentapeptide repeats
LPKCQFTTQYYDYEIRKDVDFNCQEESLTSGFCIFHDKDYLQDKTNNEEHKRMVLDRLKRKVNHAISNKEPLLCIGFQLPDFNLSDLSIIDKEFTISVYFSGANFKGEVSFSRAKFEGRTFFYEAHFQLGADFYSATFQEEANFYSAIFQGVAYFHNTNFKGEADFYKSEFYRKTYFSGQFNGKTKFHYVLFEGKEKVIFDVENLSNVSFMNTD